MQQRPDTLSDLTGENDGNDTAILVVGNPSLGNLSYNIREHNLFTERGDMKQYTLIIYSNWLVHARVLEWFVLLA